jgi:hypothetical protein
VRIVSVILLGLLAMPASVSGQQSDEAAGACRALWAPEFKVEPTFTIANLLNAPRIANEDGTVTRERRASTSRSFSRWIWPPGSPGWA